MPESVRHGRKWVANLLCCVVFSVLLYRYHSVALLGLKVNTTSRTNVSPQSSSQNLSAAGVGLRLTVPDSDLHGMLGLTSSYSGRQGSECVDVSECSALLPGMHLCIRTYVCVVGAKCQMEILVSNFNITFPYREFDFDLRLYGPELIGPKFIDVEGSRVETQGFRGCRKFTVEFTPWTAGTFKIVVFVSCAHTSSGTPKVSLSNSPTVAGEVKVTADGSHNDPCSN
eukprot:6486679-Pyramimonas_sp.AAC.1